MDFKPPQGAAFSSTARLARLLQTFVYGSAIRHLLGQAYHAAGRAANREFKASGQMRFGDAFSPGQAR